MALTMAEKGFLSYLLSLPSDWVIYKHNLYKTLPDKKGTIDTLFKSLQEKGYINSYRIVNIESGKFIGWNHIVYDEPTDNDFFQSRELPMSVSTEVGKNDPILNTNIILNTNNIVNNSTKEKNPSLEQVIKYFTEKGSTEELGKQAFEYYEAGNWHDSTGKKVKNWKQKMLSVWINNNNFNKKTTKNETRTKKTNIDYYRESYEQSIKWANDWETKG
jgi:hypothetical protein